MKLISKVRESLATYARPTATDEELLATIVGASEAKALIEATGGDLRALRAMGFEELTAIEGVGRAKAIALISAFELGRREREQESSCKAKVTSSNDAYQIMKPHFEALQYEEFWVLMLNRANMVIGTFQASTGGMAGTVADPKRIFSKALSAKASGIIIAHNHPSGNLKPSSADIQLTKKIKQGGEVLEISVLDHLIISDEGYYSFNDEGMLY